MIRNLLLVIVFLLSISGSANAILCAPSTPPPWPQIGWCQWQPDVNDHNHPGVSECTGSGPGWGFVWYYTGKTWTGKCSSTWVMPPAVNGVYSLNGNYNFVERYGYYSSANGVVTQIQSMRLGPNGASWGGQYTAVMLSTGDTAQFPGVNNYLHCSLWNVNSVVLDVDNIAAWCGLSAPVTSFYLTAQ